ncbi:MAG: SulP family inorganic anion transporter, partial [Gammaproteobacteria bacterium]
MFKLGCASRACFKNEILSGLTVALALVPEAVAFAFVAGVEPLVGLYAAFMVGLLAATLGGRPGMISGATGAMAVVMVSLVAEHGVEYLFAAVVLTGLIQISAGIKGGLPVFNIPSVPFSLETLFIILPYAVILAAVGLIESLLTLSLIDDVTNTRGRGNRECVGQGIANTVTGFFGGMGGCAMIGQSMININSGGRQRLSGIAAALFLLAFILFASSLIENIPMAALVGVMFIVVLATFEWSSLRIMGKIPRTDAFVLVLVSAVTVVTDLAIAVIVGVIVSALVFAWEHAKHINVKGYDDENGSRVYELNGPLFFGSVKSFLELFNPEQDPDDVIIEFQNSRVADHSAIEAIDNLADKYIQAGKTLHLRHLSGECRDLLKKAGDLVEVNVLEDPRYHVADDQ